MRFLKKIAIFEGSTFLFGLVLLYLFAKSKKTQATQAKIYSAPGQIGSTIESYSIANAGSSFVSDPVQSNLLLNTEAIKTKLDILKTAIETASAANIAASNVLSANTDQIEPKLDILKTAIETASAANIAANNSLQSAINNLANVLTQNTPVNYNKNQIKELIDTEIEKFGGHSVTVLVLAGSASIEVDGVLIQTLQQGASVTYEASTYLDSNLLVSGESVGTRIIVLTIN